MNTVALISPYFPPSSLAGVHRCRHLAKHLPASGWRPIVIRVHERHYAEPPDSTLATLVSPTTTQLRAEAVPRAVAGLIGIGDVSLRAYWGIKRAAADAITQHNAKALMITGGPYYPWLMARDLKRKFRIPILIDIQDPWVSHEGSSSSFFSKLGLSHRLARVLEPRALREADFITTISDVQKEELLQRYSFLEPDRISAIPIGGDPEDFAAIRQLSPQGPRPSRRFNMNFIGTLTPRFMPVVRALFQGFARLRQQHANLADLLEVNFIGTSGIAIEGARPCPQVMQLAAQEGLLDIVWEFPRRVSYTDAAVSQATSDALILLGSDEPHYSASKIYPALMSGRPYLSIFHRQSSAHEVLVRAGGGVPLAFGDFQELTSLGPQIADGITQVVFHSDTFSPADPSSYSEFTAANVAAQYARIFYSLVGSPTAADG